MIEVGSVVKLYNNEWVVLNVGVPGSDGTAPCWSMNLSDKHCTSLALDIGGNCSRLFEDPPEQSTN